MRCVAAGGGRVCVFVRVCAVCRAGVGDARMPWSGQWASVSALPADRVHIQSSLRGSSRLLTTPRLYSKLQTWPS
eukprot:3749704-Prymnesium_polylepis.1